jgi:hypothetical protein
MQIPDIESRRITNGHELSEALRSYSIESLAHPGWGASIEADRSRVWAAWYAGRVIGYAIASMLGPYEQDTVHNQVLKTLFPNETRPFPTAYGYRTHEEFLRKGAAKSNGLAMESDLRAVLQETPYRIAPILTLSVDADNEAGQALYRSLEYEVLTVGGQSVFTAKVPRNIRGGGIEAIDKEVLFMAKDLSP